MISIDRPTQNSDPAYEAVPVTKHDANNVRGTTPFRGLYVGTGGDLVLVDVKGNVTTFKNVASGSVLPVRGVRVNNTSTTAADIVALF